MQFSRLAEKRYSVRRFCDKPVEKDKIDRILAVCRTAPTAANRQPQRILVLESPAALEKLKGCTRYHFRAPLAMLICFDREQAWKRNYDGRDSGEIDCAIVGTHLMMAAIEEGLGTTWVMHFDPQAIREAYQIPDTLEPVALFPMGYPAPEDEPNPLHFKRMEVSETTLYNSF